MTRYMLRMVLLVAALAVVLAGIAVAVDGQTPRFKIASTSGIPHADIGTIRRSPYYNGGPYRGESGAWNRHVRAAIRQVTSNTPDVVLHAGDMVEGQWHHDVTGGRVFGPTSNLAQRRRAIRAAADVYYPWVKRRWRETAPGVEVLFGMGDHEVGDLGYPGPHRTRPKYKTHPTFNAAWREHFGAARYSRRRGPVGIITLDPFQRWNGRVVARLSHADIAWAARRAREMRAGGAKWVIVQSEIPLVGDNVSDGAGTSSMLLRNGPQVWRALRAAKVDLILAAEFHGSTVTTNGGRRPVQVVHGSYQTWVSWLDIDVYNGRLELTLRASRGSAGGSGRIFSTAWSRKWPRDRPSTGQVFVQGSAVLRADGRLTARQGRFLEGPQK